MHGNSLHGNTVKFGEERVVDDAHLPTDEGQRGGRDREGCEGIGDVVGQDALGDVDDIQVIAPRGARDDGVWGGGQGDRERGAGPGDVERGD